MNIIRYDAAYAHRWNDFLKNAKNYHFFFHRDYLAYHEGRFEDHSLMIFDDQQKLIALLPANIDGDTLYTHQGLTYGGFVLNDNMKAVTMLEIFTETKKYLKASGINRVIYKTIPHIHHLKPAQEDLYALFRQDAKLIQRDLGAVIDMQKPIKYSNGRKWSLKKAAAHNFRIQPSQDFSLFWPLLEEILYRQHQAKPVHSLEEISYLAERFRDNIKLYLIYQSEKLLAGAVTFDNPELTHLQYVANSEEGRRIGALDFLIDHLIKNVYTDKRYFDFGTSNEQNGKLLNEGLIDQKERFGARCVINDRYEWIL
jgi:hypothetical protein